jgi:hypothetical protein
MVFSIIAKTEAFKAVPQETLGQLVRFIFDLCRELKGNLYIGSKQPSGRKREVESNA